MYSIVSLCGLVSESLQASHMTQLFKLNIQESKWCPLLLGSFPNNAGFPILQVIEKTKIKIGLLKNVYRMHAWIHVSFWLLLGTVLPFLSICILRFFPERSNSQNKFFAGSYAGVSPALSCNSLAPPLCFSGMCLNGRATCLAVLSRVLVSSSQLPKSVLFLQIKVVKIICIRWYIIRYILHT